MNRQQRRAAARRGKKVRKHVKTIEVAIDPESVKTKLDQRLAAQIFNPRDVAAIGHDVFIKPVLERKEKSMKKGSSDKSES